MKINLTSNLCCYAEANAHNVFVWITWVKELLSVQGHMSTCDWGLLFAVRSISPLPASKNFFDFADGQCIGCLRYSLSKNHDCFFFVFFFWYGNPPITGCSRWYIEMINLRIDIGKSSGTQWSMCRYSRHSFSQNRCAVTCRSLDVRYS